MIDAPLVQLYSRCAGPSYLLIGRSGREAGTSSASLVLESVSSSEYVTFLFMSFWYSFVSVNNNIKYK